MLKENGKTGLQGHCLLSCFVDFDPLLPYKSVSVHPILAFVTIKLHFHPFYYSYTFEKIRMQ